MRTKRDLNYIKAKNRVQREKGFYNHVIIYFVVNIIITGFKVHNHFGSWDAFTTKFFGLDNLSTWLVWGAILLFHFLVFKYAGPWEDRKIEEYMEKELNKKS